MTKSPLRKPGVLENAAQGITKNFNEKDWNDDEEDEDED